MTWYQSLFGQPATQPAHAYFGQIVDTDGTVLLCLHEWDAHEHPTLASPDIGRSPAMGYCCSSASTISSRRLRVPADLVERLEEEPHRNPNTGTREFALRDPDGYYVMVSALEA